MKKLIIFLFSCVLFWAVFLPATAQVTSAKPFLGATIGILDSLPQPLRKQYKLKNKNGIMVQKVFDNSPAKTGGLAVNDVIQKLNNTTIVSPRQFIETLHTYRVGDEINLTLYRNGKKLIKPIKLLAKADTELK